MNIVEFLEARIAEDEEAARAATDGDHKWLLEEEDISLWPDDREPADGFMAFPRKAHAYHAVTWNPTRVLAECAAKRAIVEMYTGAVKASDMLGVMRADEARTIAQAAAVTAEGALKALAAVYDQHPDYDQTWKVPDTKRHQTTR